MRTQACCGWSKLSQRGFCQRYMGSLFDVLLCFVEGVLTKAHEGSDAMEFRWIECGLAGLLQWLQNAFGQKPAGERFHRSTACPDLLKN